MCNCKYMAKEKKFKIAHFPTDLGMRAYSLCKAERELGLDSWVIIRYIGSHSSDSFSVLYSPNPILYTWRLLRAFQRNLEADIIMANAGSSLFDFNSNGLNLLDIPIYKSLGKRIFVTYQGCDIRLCEYCPVRISLPKSLFCPNMQYSSYKNFDRVKLRKLNIWMRYADAILGITPDLCLIDGIEYTPHAKYLYNINDIVTEKGKNECHKIRICHMYKAGIPGAGYLKGTQLIENTLKAILVKYPNNVEYIPFSGLSWENCLKFITTCDILIDQVVMGWYGGISVEASLSGTLPVAYIDKSLLRFVPRDMRDNLPVMALEDKNQLFSVLEGLILNRDKLYQETIRCYHSALTFHEAKNVARQIISKYYISNKESLS